MSDYCQQCPYDRKARVGEKACPFNSLYWDFLDRHADKLQNNHRMALVYKAWGRFEADDQAAILERADWVKNHVETL
jgi:deoxyribodipyrimidine photolyase-related protein